MNRTINKHELYYTVLAVSSLLSWATDHHGKIYAWESPDWRAGGEPRYQQHLNKAQEEIAAALAQIKKLDE
jgi:hypothetical protein